MAKCYYGKTEAEAFLQMQHSKIDSVDDSDVEGIDFYQIFTILKWE